jgi:hypothetical protein
MEKKLIMEIKNIGELKGLIVGASNAIGRVG